MHFEMHWFNHTYHWPVLWTLTYAIPTVKNILYPFGPLTPSDIWNTKSTSFFSVIFSPICVPSPFCMYLHFIYQLPTESIDHKLEASSPGTLLEMNLRLHPKLTESESIFNKIQSWFLYTLMFYKYFFSHFTVAIFLKILSSGFSTRTNI